MKAAFYALVVLTVGGLIAGVLGEGSEPYKVSHGYIHIRPGGVTANDTALTVSTSSWHDISGWARIPEDWASVSIAFYAYGDGSGSGNPGGGVYDANVYVAHEYGSAIPVASLSVVMGDLQLSHDPAYGWGSHYRESQVADPNYKWAEGPVLVNASYWRSPVEASGTTNGIGEVHFDHSGATHIRVLFDNIADVTKVYAVMTGRK